MVKFGHYKHIIGKDYEMYYTPTRSVNCSKYSAKGKWILTKSTRKGLFKLSSHTSRSLCLRALTSELGL